MMATLPRLTPDADRAARVVARCRRRLADRAEAAARASRQPRSNRLERSLTAGLCALYLSSVIVISLEVFAAF